jgi:hypothetical protein
MTSPTDVRQELQPGTTLGLILRASAIPDGSTVTKKTGRAEYVLRHNLAVYRPDSLGGPVPLEVKGCFLVGPRGSVNQIEPGTELLWLISVVELHDLLSFVVDPPEDK